MAKPPRRKATFLVQANRLRQGRRYKDHRFPKPVGQIFTRVLRYKGPLRAVQKVEIDVEE